MLVIDDLEIILGGETVIRIPRLEVKKGDYLVIMGPTGAGKTVLLETIAGFHRPRRGKITLEGKDITALPPNKRDMAMVYQDFMLFPHMSVRRNIEYPLRARGEKRYGEVERIAEILEISHLLDRMPKTLSGGEKQRVAIARAIITRPKMLLMDEPFGSLDRKSRERARAVVKKAIEEYGATVIHITHDLETALALGKRIAVMHRGELLQVGEVDEILSRPNPEFVASFFDSNILSGVAMGRRDGLTVIRVGSREIYTSDPAEGKVHISIRPESIILSRGEIESSMRNGLRGKVVGMEPRGTVVRITVDFGDFSLVSVLTPNAIHALSIEEGEEVFAYFKASSVRVV